MSAWNHVDGLRKDVKSHGQLRRNGQSHADECWETAVHYSEGSSEGDALSFMHVTQALARV